MKKIEIIDVLKHRLAGGDCPQELKGKYHPEIISKHITMVLNYLIKDVLYKEILRDNNWGLLDSYVKSFENISILENENRNEKYSILPASVVSLPANRGVRLVCYMQTQSSPFFYRNNNTSNIYGGLDVEEVSQQVRYYVEGNKVYYSNHITATASKVLMKLIVTFDNLEDDDDIEIPSGYGKLLFELVMQSMLGMPLEKISNDNNANTI